MPALAIPTGGPQPEPDTTSKTGSEAAKSLLTAVEYSRWSSEELDISDENVPVPHIEVKDLPHCPECQTGLLRPGVVWFGEALPSDTLDAIDKFIEEDKPIDLIMVIGTSAKVYPAASYVDVARQKGARVAVVNMDRADAPGGPNGLVEGDWFFQGDAGVLVPEMLKTVIGEL